MQSEAWVAWHGCSLLDIPVLPMAPPDAARPAQTSDAASFRSFAAGYLKREHLIRVLHHKPRCRCIDLPSDRPIQVVVGMQHAGLVQGVVAPEQPNSSGTRQFVSRAKA